MYPGTKIGTTLSRLILVPDRDELCLLGLHFEFELDGPSGRIPGARPQPDSMLSWQSAKAWCGLAERRDLSFSEQEIRSLVHRLERDVLGLYCMAVVVPVDVRQYARSPEEIVKSKRYEDARCASCTTVHSRSLPSYAKITHALQGPGGSASSLESPPSLHRRPPKELIEPLTVLRRNRTAMRPLVFLCCPKRRLVGMEGQSRH
jgi:hypothetical protein